MNNSFLPPVARSRVKDGEAAAAARTTSGGGFSERSERSPQSVGASVLDTRSTMGGMGVVNIKFVPHPLRDNFAEQKNAPPSERLPERACASERDGARTDVWGLTDCRSSGKIATKGVYGVRNTRDRRYAEAARGAQGEGTAPFAPRAKLSDTPRRSSARSAGRRRGARAPQQQPYADTVFS